METQKLIAGDFVVSIWDLKLSIPYPTLIDSQHRKACLEYKGIFYVC